MTQPAARTKYAGLAPLFFIAALVVFIIAALLGFSVFGSVTLERLIALIAVGEACAVAGVLV
jgi:hypothetical protein